MREEFSCQPKGLETNKKITSFTFYIHLLLGPKCYYKSHKYDTYLESRESRGGKR